MNWKRTKTVLALAGLTAVAGACSNSVRTTETTTRQAPLASAERSMDTGTTVTGWPTRRSGGDMAWTSMAYPTGEARTSALGIEKGLPREVRVNQPFEYDLVVTNLTNRALNDVVVSEKPQNNMRITATNPTVRPGSDGVYNWALGALGPKESKTIKVTGVAGAEGSVGSCATASYASQLCATVPVVEPKLRLTKTGPAEAMKCDEIVYRFKVENPGTGTVSNVRINDPLPNGLMTTDGKRAIAINVGDLKAGQAREFTARVTPERTGRFENKATASGDGVNAESMAVATVIREPVLKIVCEANAREFIGRPLEYKITVTNVGDGIAENLVVTETAPAGAQFVSATDGGRMVGGKVTWNIGSLAPRASKTVTARMTAGGAGTLNATAMVKGDCAAPVTCTSTTEVTGIPAILLEVIDLEDPDLVGTDETYVITVTNQGSAPATNVRIVATLEPNQTYVSSTGAASGSARGNVITFAPVASIAPKAKATYRVTVKNVKAGDVRFQVTMTSDQLTRPVHETEATNVYE